MGTEYARYTVKIPAFLHQNYGIISLKEERAWQRDEALTPFWLTSQFGGNLPGS
jgi:hypothetical protein